MQLPGHTLLLRDGEATILFPPIGVMQNTPDHQEVLLVSEMVRGVIKYILQVMIMLVVTITMEMDIMSKLDDLPITCCFLGAPRICS